MIQPAVAKRGVVITGISNPLLQATARTVQVAVATADKKRRFSDPADHQLTRDSLTRTMAWLDARKTTPDKKTPLDKLSDGQLALLTGPRAPASFVALNKLIDVAEAARVDAPYFREIPVSELKNPTIAECASAIALYFSEVTPKNTLTCGQLNAAYDEFVRSSEPGFVPSDAFVAAQAHPEFTRENVEALYIYMRTGMGGLVTRGSIEGSGYQFDTVFKLPRLPQVDLPDNKPFDQQPSSKQRKYLTETINAYEAQFAKTGYDRIYTIGDDNEVYVALHDKGSLRRISPGAMMAFTDPSRYHDANATWQLGRIERIVDVNNTWQEASFGMWGRFASGWADTANNKFRSVSEKPFETLTEVSGKLPIDPAKVPTGTNPLLLAAGFAGVATALQGHNIGEIVAYGAAAFVGLTTGLSVWNVYRTGKDITPFLEATGHVINTDALRADDI